MKVYFDTNILLDVLLKREPFVTDSRRVWSLAERHTIKGMISVLTLPTIYYIARRVSDRAAALSMVRDIRTTFTVLPCDDAIVDHALAADLPDFEDAIQYFSAKAAGATCILTRDPAAFASSTIAVVSPTQFLATDSSE